MRTVVDKDGYHLLLKDNALSANEAAPPVDINMFDALVARVRAGEPIHVTGALDDVQGRLHVAMVNRLRAETGMPVHVIHS